MTDFLLSDDQLSAMREDVARMLPGTAIIQSVTISIDAAGNAVETWTAVTGGTVSCRLDPNMSARQAERVGGAEGMKVDYLLTVPYDAPLTDSVRISIDGEIYEIRQIADAHGWNVSRRAWLSRVV